LSGGENVLEITILWILPVFLEELFGSMASNYDTMNLKDLKVEAKKLMLPFSGKVLKADLLGMILAAVETTKDREKEEEREDFEASELAKAQANLKERERDAAEVAKLSADLRARELRDEIELLGFHNDQNQQLPSANSKSKSSKSRHLKAKKRAREDDHDDVRTDGVNPARSKQISRREDYTELLPDGDQAARRPSLTWGDILEDEDNGWDDLETRFFATLGAIQCQTNGEPNLADRGFEITERAEPGDFVAVLRLMPDTPLTWKELQKTWLDFYKVQRVTAGGIQVVFAQSMGPTRADDDDGADSAPVLIRGGGEVLRAIGGLLQRLQSAPVTKTAASDGVGHKNEFFDTITGTKLRYTDKTNVATRVPASRVMRRLSTREVLNSLMEDDVHFDATKAWSKLVREAAIRQEQHRPGVRTEQHLAVYKWSAIQRLPVTKRGQDYFLKTAEGSWDEISLSLFSDVPLSTTNNNADKMSLAGALENVGRFFTFCHGGSWDSVVQPFIVRIREGDWSDDSWESSFLQNELEGVFRFFFHVLHGTSTKVCQSQHGGNLGTPKTVGDWLEQLLEELEPIEARQNRFLRQRVATAGKERPHSVTPKTSAPALTKPVGSRDKSGQPTSARSAGVSGTHQTSKLDAGDRFCRYHFLHALGVEGVNGAPYRACTESPCRYPHPDVSRLGKSKIVEMAQKIFAIPVFGAKVKSQLERSIAARK
jgi:hypothetical protein